MVCSTKFPPQTTTGKTLRKKQSKLSRLISLGSCAEQIRSSPCSCGAGYCDKPSTSSTCYDDQEWHRTCQLSHTCMVSTIMTRTLLRRLVQRLRCMSCRTSAKASSPTPSRFFTLEHPGTIIDAMMYGFPRQKACVSDKLSSSSTST